MCVGRGGEKRFVMKNDLMANINLFDWQRFAYLNFIVFAAILMNLRNRWIFSVRFL